MDRSTLKDMTTNFRWYQSQPVSYSLQLGDLLEETAVHQHLTRLVTDFGSPDKAHAASMTAKRIGYAAALMIYARIKHNVSIRQKECLLLTTDEQSGKTGWLPVYSFPLQSAESDSSPADWITKELYAQALLPIIGLLAKEKGISRVVLLENIFIYIKWILLTKLQDSHLYWQLIEMPASEYGAKNRHPLAFFQNASAVSRKTCCLFYRTAGDAEPCKTCPRRF